MPKLNVKAKTCNCGFEQSCIHCKPGGNAGPQGFRGLMGDMGSQGYQGAQGDIGVGETGFQGDIGLRGITGDLGFQGYQGYQGQPGNDAETTGLEYNIDVLCGSETHIAVTPGVSATLDASLSLGPKVGGLGFVSAQKPTPGFSVGGDCRGEHSVDWQMSRSDSLDVASGNRSFIGGGHSNRVTGAYSVVVGGSGNQVTTDIGAIVGGRNNLVSFVGASESFGAILSGYNGVVSDQYAVVLSGKDNNVSGKSSLIGSGIYQTVSGNYSSIVTGYRNVNSGPNSFIGSSYYSSIGSSDSSAILSAKFSSISSFGNFGVILSGNDNSVASGLASLIGNGYSNQIDAGSVNGKYNTILNGGSHDILGTNIEKSTILNGDTNYIAASQGLIGTGRNNSLLEGANYSTILNGLTQSVSGEYSLIWNGRLNTIVGSSYSLIGGNNNSIVGVSGSRDIQNILLNGDGNRISGVGRSLILNGSGNVISSGDDGAGGLDIGILGGRGNTMTGSNFDSVIVVGGIDHEVSGSSIVGSTIVGGSGNMIKSDVSYSLIGAGVENILDSGAVNAGIFVGSENTVSGTGAAVVNGVGNSVSGKSSASMGSDGAVVTHNRAVVIGGGGAGAVSHDDDSVTVGGRLFIETVDPFSSASEVLMWDPTTKEVESKDLSSFIAGGGSGGGVTGLAGSYSFTACGGGFVALEPSGVLPFNASIIVAPRGTGFLAATVPDGSIGGGNCRGDNAVDFQMNRIDSSEVASGNNSVIVGGKYNRSNGIFGAIVGGVSNRVTSAYGFVGNGANNTAAGAYTSVVGGRSNEVIARYSSILGGRANNISLFGPYGVVVGGLDNDIRASQSLIGNGAYNRIYESGDVSYANVRNTILNGTSNVIGGTRLQNSSILGGSNNLVTGAYCLNSVILSGDSNVINISGTGAESAQGGMILHGIGNTAFGSSSVVINGTENFVGGSGSMVLNGSHNKIIGDRGIVVSGYDSIVDGSCGLVLGGDSHRIGGNGGVVVGGRGHTVSATGAVVVGGVSGSGIHNNAVLVGGRGFSTQADSSVNLGGTGGLFVENVEGPALDDQILVWNPSSYQIRYRSAGSIITDGVDITPYYSGVSGGTAICLGDDHLSIRPSLALSGNASISIGPLGSGFISTQVPDGTTGGGNCRGRLAVDWQMSRDSPDQVASGEMSGVLSGYSNSSLGTYTVVAGGKFNVAGGSGTGAFVGGGVANVATGAYSLIVGGSGNHVSGDFSGVVGGLSNVVDYYGVRSFVLGGYENLIGIGPTGDGTGPVGYTGETGTFSISAGTGSRNEDCSIICGRENVIQTSRDGSMNLIGGGMLNRIDGDYSNSSAILNGYQNLVQNSSYSSIVGGSENRVMDSYHSVVIGGFKGVITGGQKAVVIGGRELIGSHENSVVIGGSDFSSQGDDSVNIGGQTFVKDVPNDNTQLKFMVWDSSSYLLKYRDFSSFIAEGPQGDDGSQGPQGIMGFPGCPGAQGFQGWQGWQGWQGVQGETGVQGVQGYQGYQGDPGFGLGKIGSSLKLGICSGRDHVSIFPDSSLSYNSSISIGPRGGGLSQGFISAQSPIIGGVLGGNCRGTNSVDWQMKRGLATQVASGDFAVVAGGRSNAAIGAYTVVGGGFGNTAGGSGTGAFVGGGVGNQATGVYSVVVGGQGNKSLATGAFIGAGQDNIASGKQSAIIGGYGNSVLAGHTNAVIIGGSNLNSKGANSVYLGGKQYLNLVSGPLSPSINRVLVWNSVTKEVGFRFSSGLIKGLDLSYSYSLCGTKDHLGIQPDIGILDPDSSVSIGPDPNGSGFLSAHQPTASSVGGNCRGSGAVDWQLSRNLLTEVASGNYSFLGAGRRNRVDGTFAGMMGGFLNYIGSGGIGSAMIGGYNNSISSAYSTILSGSNHTIPVGYDRSSIIGGDSLTSPGSNTVLIGGDLYVDNMDGPYNTNAYILTWDSVSKKIVYREASSLGGGGSGGGGGGATGVLIGYYSSICPCAGPSEDHVVISPNSLTLSPSSSISIGPIGSGFLSAQKPTCSAAGGNCRGVNAVDFQMSRSFATQVASGTRSFIGNGQANQADSQFSVVVGGRRGTSIADYSFIGNGNQNTVSGLFSSVINGKLNSVSGDYSSVLSGYRGMASNQYSLVLGGDTNTSSGKYSLIGNGRSHISSGDYGVVVNGRVNLSSGKYSFIGNGKSNIASSSYSTIVGGFDNRADSVFGGIFLGRGNLVDGDQVGGVIVSGRGNTINAPVGYNYSMIGGGRSNTINGGYGAFIGAGQSNTISVDCGRSVISGGQSNTISSGGRHSVISGGELNVVSGGADHAFIGGGLEGSVSGERGVVVGGSGNVVDADLGFIGGGMGNNVSANLGMIVGGSGHVVSGGGIRGAILGGHSHLVSGSDSAVIGGSGHVVSYSRAVIIGGDGLNSKGDDTVLVGGKLFVEDVAGPYNYDSNILVWDSITREIRFRSAASLGSTGGSGGAGAGAGGTGLFTNYYTNYCSSGQDLLVVRPDSNVMSSNSSLVVGPLGNGFLSGQKPNGLVVGGNCRGNRAVDWQLNRGLATQVASGNYSVISGGSHNCAQAKYTSVGGGYSNCIGVAGYYGVISGGRGNSVNVQYGSVVGGKSGTVDGEYSIILGGASNSVTSGGDFGMIGVAKSSSVSSVGGGVLLGSSHNVSGKYGLVLSGRSNVASSKYATVINGEVNRANGSYSLVGNGQYNVASGYMSFVAGGKSNTASARYSSVINGNLNQAQGAGSIVLTGQASLITPSGNYSSILSGSKHTVTHENASIIGGFCKTSKGDDTVLVGGKLFVDTVDDSSGGDSEYVMIWNNLSQEVEKRTVSSLVLGGTGILNVETADGPTGAVTSGPFELGIGDTLRFWSAGGISAAVEPGSALVQLEPNNIQLTTGSPTGSPDDPTRPMIRVDSLTNEIYTWIPGSGATGSWELASAVGSGSGGIFGATGPQGPPGTTGVQGGDGARGETGTQGDTGTQGVTGPRGDDIFQNSDFCDEIFMTDKFVIEKNFFNQLGDDIDGVTAGAQSGYSVSLNATGDIVAISSPRNDGNGSQRGIVRVYQWDGSSWIQLGVDISGEADGDRSGRSISLNADGDIVAIGAIGNDGNGSLSGHVRVYQWNGSSWIQLGADIDGEGELDQSGYSVSLNDTGDIVAIGSIDNASIGSGHVRVYQWDGSLWTQLGARIDGEASGDESGYSVSLNSAGDIVAIGAPFNDGVTGSNNGHVRVYEYLSPTWTQLGDDIDGEAEDDQSGYSVSLNAEGDIVAIGARYNDDNGNVSGHVRVWQWNSVSMTWTQLGSDIEGEASGDQSGYSVSLNAEGDIVAIGAIGNDDNGLSSGHVRVYQWDGSLWRKLGTDINGEASDDRSGYSVSLNSAGDIVAIGAPFNDDNGNFSGHTRIYETKTKLCKITISELFAKFQSM